MKVPLDYWLGSQIAPENVVNQQWNWFNPDLGKTS